jgi:hypothetical protein
MTEKNMPEKKFSAGAVVATVWKNVAEKNEKPVEYRTVTFERRYKDKAGAWQTSNSIRVNDLPKAALVIEKAYEYLVLKEPDHNYVEEGDY